MTPDDWSDDIAEIWNESIGDFLTGADLAMFTDDGAELFYTGWIDMEASADEREDARAAFFSLMEDFDIGIDQFDWDHWRDWYDAA